MNMSEIIRVIDEELIDFSKKDGTVEYVKSLLPEIANTLNCSVGELEERPFDVQIALAQTYVNVSSADELTIKVALSQIIELNTQTQTEIDRLKAEKSKENESNVTSVSRYISRCRQQKVAYSQISGAITNDKNSLSQIKKKLTNVSFQRERLS